MLTGTSCLVTLLNTFVRGLLMAAFFLVFWYTLTRDLFL